jgi:hypothetical protein
MEEGGLGEREGRREKGKRERKLFTNIIQIPASIGNMTSLRYLHAYNNNLKSLPTELVSCR